jgi:valyl-tRNA synthetase
VAWVRDEILKLLHPFMPYITEELWAVTAKRANVLALAAWPIKAEDEIALEASMQMAMAGDPLAVPVVPPYATLAETFSDPKAEAEIGWLIDLVTTIRSVRAEMNIAPATLFPLILVGASKDLQARAVRWSDVIKRMARVAEISFDAAAPQGSLQLLVRGEVAAIPLKGVIDLAAEKVRLEKELAKAQADIARVDAKLGNEKFVANAPEEVIDEQREKREEADGRRAKIVDALERLKAAG